jgi:hypothetical protein
MKLTGLMSLVAMTACLTACGEQTPSDYLSIAGGGFVFNYRYSQAYYVFVAQPKGPLPGDAVLEASFDVPGSTTRFVVQDKVLPGKLQYKFQSEVLHGIVKDYPYKVTLRLLDGPTGKQLDFDEATYRSDVDQSTLPSEPPVEGVEFKPIVKSQ